jgi:uncharacterized protein YcfL
MKTKVMFQWIASLLATLVIGCRSAPDVVVVDDKGAPIADAAVEPVSLSMNYKAVVTDSKGEASIGSKVQHVKWINVHKTGFTDQNSIDFIGPKPIRVTLKP